MPLPLPLLPSGPSGELYVPTYARLVMTSLRFRWPCESTGEAVVHAAAPCRNTRREVLWRGSRWVIDYLSANAFKISQAFRYLPGGVDCLILNVIMAHAGFSCGAQSRGDVHQTFAQRHAGFLRHVSRGAAQRRAVANILDMHQGKAAGVLMQQLHRILIRKDNPED